MQARGATPSQNLYVIWNHSWFEPDLWFEIWFKFWKLILKFTSVCPSVIYSYYWVLKWNRQHLVPFYCLFRIMVSFDYFYTCFRRFFYYLRVWNYSWFLIADCKLKGVRDCKKCQAASSCSILSVRTCATGDQAPKPLNNVRTIVSNLSRAKSVPFPISPSLNTLS